MTTPNFPYIPDSAPFSPEQRGWLNGFFAGMFTSQGDLGAAESTPNAKKAVTILWGSQTGNCESLARTASKVLGGKGFAPTVFDMGEYDPARLKDEELLLIITSTYGEGEPPDNAAGLHAWLQSEQAPRFERLKYSVLALGDTNYPDFCKCGIEFDERLKALGGDAIVARAECDVDYEGVFQKWISSVELAAGASAEHSGRPPMEESAVSTAYGKKNPFPAKVLRNYNLNGEGSSKETRHVEISLSGSGLRYEPGDALAILPTNDAGYVDDLLQVAGFAGDELVEAPNGGRLSLREALSEFYDVTNLNLKTLGAYAKLSGSEALKVMAEDREAFASYAWGRQIIDLLLEEPFSFSSAAELLGLFSRLTPRLYSISSSPKAHPEEVHVTVGVVRYNSHGRARSGVCSNFLAGHGGEAPVHVFLHHNKSFKLPADPRTPIIMVGPGTGIAPFRAFLEERQAAGATGPSWLFFGDQHEACDFLYQKQLVEYVEKGTLSRLDTAFSRDQERKIYVQDRMRDHGKELFRWLEKGASFYVCGDASRMAKDVDLALRDIVSQHGGCDAVGSLAYLERLKREKRYLRDVY